MGTVPMLRLHVELRNSATTATCLVSFPGLPASFGMRSEAEVLVSQVTLHDVKLHGLGTRLLYF